MKSTTTNIRLLLLTLPLAIASSVEQVQAQSITPANDGTNTSVTSNGNQINISGGKLSGDEANLFHSFTKFGLNADQIANFLSNPKIQNILGRVVGGDASIINGLIQVTGGNSNLFLINPAGIIFGVNASLNVPASFTATTANVIGFGDSPLIKGGQGGAFNAIGVNDYATLIGNPSTFAFTMSQPGVIVNAGNLAVGQGQNLTLLGGAVVNTGQLSAPEGNITVAAVPGKNMVRLSQQGQLLNLEIQPIFASTSLLQSWNLPILSLPQLLTGGSVSNATGLKVNNNGQVVLTGSGTNISADTATAIVSGTINVQGITGGKTQFFGDKVGLIGANINASGTNNGGIVLIGGDYQGKGTTPNAARTYISSDSIINANSFLNGDGGRVIVWANQTTEFYGSISARGGTISGNGGFVEVSGKENLIFNGTVNLNADNGNLGTLLLDPLNITIVDGSTGVNDAEVADNEIFASDPGENFTISETALETLAADANIILEATNNITISDLADNTLNIQATTGSITFTADTGSFSMDASDTISTQGGAVKISGASVNVGGIQTRGGNIDIIAKAGNIQVNGDFGIQAGISNRNGGDITLNTSNNIIRRGTGSIASNIDSGNGNSGDITLIAGGNITDIPLSSFSKDTGNGGNINLTANGNIKHIGITATANNGSGGNITLNAGGNITGTGSADISSSATNGNGGNITFNADGNIEVDDIFSSGSLNGGNVSLFSGGAIDSTIIDGTPGAIISSSSSGKGGNITLQSATDIFTNRINSSGFLGGGNISFTSSGVIQEAFFDSSSTNGNGGAITLSAPIDITVGSINSTGLPDTGNISLTSNEIDLTAGANSVQGKGNILLQPFTPNQNIEIAGGVTSALDLSATDLVALKDGFSSITIGRSDSSGVIAVLNSVTFNDPVTIQAPVGSGAIAATGAITGQDNAAITLIANRNITTSNITANSGITLTSSNGNIDTSAGALNSSSSNGDGGAIALTALGKITTSALNSSATGFGNGGNITLSSYSGTIDTTDGSLNSFSDSGNGGAIALTALGDITTSDINSSGKDIALTSQTGAVTTADLTSTGAKGGGAIAISARERIETGLIDSSSSLGNGGNVTLDPLGDIQVAFINAQGGTNGKGGNVDITTAQFFRATDIFTDQNGVNASISTAGGEGGNIIIRHGGNGITPFIVGNAITNGTDGAITTGNSNPIQTLGSGSFLYNYTQDKIQIISVPKPPLPPPSPPALADNPLPEPYPNPPLQSPLTDEPPSVSQINEGFPPEEIPTSEFEQYLELPSRKIKTLVQMRNTLQEIEKVTGVKPALIYVSFVPKNIQSEVSKDKIKALEESQKSGRVWQLNTQKFAGNLLAQSQTQHQKNYIEQDSDQLELILVTTTGEPIRKRISQAMRSEVLFSAEAFRREVADPSKTRTQSYLAKATQFYQWTVAPLETDLQAQGIQNLVFIMDAGLRSLPVAAFHNGQGFLIEKYSVGLMPSLSLTDTRYVDIKKTKLLAMGESIFPDKNPLPAVPLELSIITKKAWKGIPFLNEAFTLDNLKFQRAATPFGIIHLATHGEFQSGASKNSYIQMWDTKLKLDNLRQLGWNDPPVELLVLSACRMAVGDREAELGFAGLATQAGVKSAVASLWYVSDEGTLGLMTQFYQHLKTAPIKAEALRQAQIAMLKGQVRLKQGQLQFSGGQVPLPPELKDLGNRNLSHPYYWSAFTMIGNPW